MPEQEIMKPKYTIIIINHEGLRQTVACVESILANTKDFELIIVDNDSHDGSRGYFDALIAMHKNIKIIETDRKYAFSENNNFALAKAQGEYVIFLNNDTVVSKDWLERMELHFTNVPIKNIGAVGPVCNNSNGRQMVGLQDPEEWYAKNKGKWSNAGILYGWCMMFRKSVLDEIGGFDENFLNSHEDNDLSLRAVLAGYSLVIAYDVYIYHEGQATLRKKYNGDEYLDNGIRNREYYRDKWYENKPKKLVAVYRTNGGKYLEESLKQTSKFADSIIIHFCRCQDKNKALDLVKKFEKIVKYEFYDGIFQEDYERNWLLQEALKMQAAGEADWCISIDDDEIYEDKFIHRCRAMMNPRDPQVMAYACNWRTIWKNEMGVDYYRADSTFGNFVNYRFWRLIPGQEIRSFSHPEGHHCGSAPIMPPEFIQWTSIRVKHLGYDTPEQRQRKFEFYEVNDHFKRKEDIGYEDYSHLIDKSVTYHVYDPDLTLSCVMMVKNEQDNIQDCLEQFMYVVDEFVIVDTGSSDNTMDIIKKFAEYSPVPVNVYSYPWEDNYSTPRNFGKSKANGKWIIRMDADERFKPSDFKQLFSLIEADNDFVSFHVLNYMEQPLPGRKLKYASTEAVRMYKNIPEIFYTGVIHESLDDALVWLSSKKKIKGERASFELHHYGYIKNKNKLRSKLDYYETLNKKQIEITDGTDPRSYFNLALHYLNDEKDSEALKALQTAIEIDPMMWHASKQMAALNIKSARAFLGNAMNSLPPDHSFRNDAKKMIEVMDKFPIGTVKVT